MNHEPLEILELNEPEPPERGRPLASVLADWLRAHLPATAPFNMTLAAIVGIGLLTGIGAGLLLV